MSYSELGRGSTFKVYFAASSGIWPNRGVIRIEPTPHGTEKVLLVEDEDQGADNS